MEKTPRNRPHPNPAPSEGAGRMRERDPLLISPSSTGGEEAEICLLCSQEPFLCRCDARLFEPTFRGLVMSRQTQGVGGEPVFQCDREGMEMKVRRVTASDVQRPVVLVDSEGKEWLFEVSWDLERVGDPKAVVWMGRRFGFVRYEMRLGKQGMRSFPIFEEVTL